MVNWIFYVEPIRGLCLNGFRIELSVLYNNNRQKCVSLFCLSTLIKGNLMKTVLKSLPLAMAASALLLTSCGAEDKAATVAETAAPAEQTAPVASVLTLDTADQKISYFAGYNMAQSVSNDDTVDFDIDLLIAGIRDAAAAKESQVSQEQVQAASDELQQRMQAKAEELRVEAEKKAAENQQAGVTFLETNKAKEGVTTTESGLQYEVLDKGSSEKSPAPTDVVKVHYHGKLIDGTVFDSSVDRGEPASFPLNTVISGWTEGLQLMSEGDKFRFTIPAELAYGERAQGQIPGNSVLIFDVELLEVLPQSN